MLRTLSYNSTLNRRERYSKITVKYWEAEEYLDDLEYLFWLEDVITFTTKGEEVVIPITSNSSGDTEQKVDLILQTHLWFGWDSDLFPVKGKDRPKDLSNIVLGEESQFIIWGEDDNMTILSREFSEAGGEYGIEYNTEENQWEFRLTPPTSNIGTNSNFSITLEGSVPSLVISGLGYRYTKKEIVAHTEHYGIVDNDLEVDLDHVAGKSMALNAMQRLLQKYNTLQPTYDYSYMTLRDDEYLENANVEIDNNTIIPQSVSVDLQGEHAIKNASKGIPHNELGMLIRDIMFGTAERPLSQVSRTDVTLDEMQYNLKAYIH